VYFYYEFPSQGMRFGVVVYRGVLGLGLIVVHCIMILLCEVRDGFIVVDLYYEFALRREKV
jgi:hypothetical protein